VAERLVRDAELQLAPSLNVSSQVSYATQAILGPNALWSVQGVLNVPFYDGGARYGAMRDASAAAEQARQTLVSARLGAIVGAAQAQRAVACSSLRTTSPGSSATFAQRIDSERATASAGVGTSLDLVTSAQALRQAGNELGLTGVSGRTGHAPLPCSPTRSVSIESDGKARG